MCAKATININSLSSLGNVHFFQFKIKLRKSQLKVLFNPAAPQNHKLMVRSYNGSEGVWHLLVFNAVKFCSFDAAYTSIIVNVKFALCLLLQCS